MPSFMSIGTTVIKLRIFIKGEEEEEHEQNGKIKAKSVIMVHSLVLTSVVL